MATTAPRKCLIGVPADAKSRTTRKFFVGIGAAMVKNRFTGRSWSGAVAWAAKSRDRRNGFGGLLSRPSG